MNRFESALLIAIVLVIAANTSHLFVSEVVWNISAVLWLMTAALRWRYPQEKPAEVIDTKTAKRREEK